MEYRKLGNTDLDVSILGMGIGAFSKLPPEILISTMNSYLDNGVNIIDLFNPSGEAIRFFAQIINVKKKDAILQAHLGFTYVEGQEVKTFEVDKVKANFEEIVKVLDIDYIDIGMSSHNPVMSLKAVEAGLIDVLMFSLNPHMTWKRKIES